MTIVIVAMMVAVMIKMIMIKAVVRIEVIVNNDDNYSCIIFLYMSDWSLKVYEVSSNNNIDVL